MGYTDYSEIIKKKALRSITVRVGLKWAKVVARANAGDWVLKVVCCVLIG